MRLKKLDLKNLIRNYAENIIKIRDEILNQANLDINDWLNDEITKEQVDKVIININVGLFFKFNSRSNITVPERFRY